VRRRRPASGTEARSASGATGFITRYGASDAEARPSSYYKGTSDARQGMHDLMGDPAPLVVTNWSYP
jgi:hypothetical protein